MCSYSIKANQHPLFSFYDNYPNDDASILFQIYLKLVDIYGHNINFDMSMYNYHPIQL